MCCRGAKIAKMPSELITVSLNRESGSDEPWGFEITGGKDVDEQLAISHVREKNIYCWDYFGQSRYVGSFYGTVPISGSTKKGDKVTLFRAKGQNKIS